MMGYYFFVGIYKKNVSSMNFPYGSKLQNTLRGATRIYH